MAALVMSSNPPPLPPRTPGAKGEIATPRSKAVLALPSRQPPQGRQKHTTIITCNTSRPLVPTSDRPTKKITTIAVIASNAPPLPPPRVPSDVQGHTSILTLPRTKTLVSPNNVFIPKPEMFPRRPSEQTIFPPDRLNTRRCTEPIIRLTNDLEAQYMFHCVEDLPEPEQFNNVKKAYPSLHPNEPYEVSSYQRKQPRPLPPL